MASGELGGGSVLSDAGAVVPALDSLPLHLQCHLTDGQLPVHHLLACTGLFRVRLWMQETDLLEPQL